MRRGTYEDALKDAEKSIKIKPKYAKGHVRKAAALHAMKMYDEEVAAIKDGLKLCPDDATLKKGLEAANQNSNSKATETADKAKETRKAKQDFVSKERKTKTGGTKKHKNVSQFVAETKKILELQMAALQAQLDMVNELTRMTIKEKLDLLFSLMDKDGDGTIDAKELADGLRKQNDGLSFSGSIEKSIEMIAIFDDDGDAELDREEFEHFVEKMVVELDSSFDEFAEFLVYQILFSDKKEVEEEEAVDLEKVNLLVKERGELLDSLSDPRMMTLFRLFDIDGDGSVSFKEVACGLYHLTKDMEESAKATTGLLLMLDKDDQRVLGFQQFAKLILAIAATTGITFDEVADDLTLALTSDDAELDAEVLERLTLADEEYVQARDQERKLNQHREEVLSMDPLSYNRSVRLFDLWDVNGDGEIDFDELFEGLCKYHAAAKDQRDESEIELIAQKLMEHQDVDGNNVLDRDEFACAMVKYAGFVNADLHELIDYMCVVTSLGDQITSRGRYK
jgi:Ca2+-binding EF-hand superfamily protein